MKEWLIVGYKALKTTIFTPMFPTGAERASRVPWTIFRGETKMSCTETIYPQDSQTHSEYRLYASVVAGVL